MCRFVIVVIFVSCVSFGVLAEGDPAKPNIPGIGGNKTCTRDDPELSVKRKEWHKCFNNTVKLHLHPGEPVTGDCHTITDFGEKINTYIQFVNKRCNKNLTLNTKNLIKLMEYSLKNDSFKKFYDDIECVKKYESNISNSCVVGKVGFFNITAEKKHTSWATKAKLYYWGPSCSLNKEVGNCVQAVLHKGCKSDTEEYIKNLFHYTRELGNCSQYPESTLPPPGTSGAAAASWLTLPVIITLSIGAVVVVVAIIIIVVLKCKNK